MVDGAGYFKGHLIYKMYLEVKADSFKTSNKLDQMKGNRFSMDTDADVEIGGQLIDNILVMVETYAETTEKSIWDNL